jgi:hypothetical protein
MSESAAGSFDVEMKPEAASGDALDLGAGSRFSLLKHFRGGLEATGTGDMLAVRTGTEGSAGYVAMERVVGTLQGRAGSFALQHSGTMDRGRPTLSVTIVPDSGTGDLAGIAGEMSIEVTPGGHSYVLRYTLG